MSATKDYDYNNETHHLIELKEVPDSLVELRKELMYHSEITKYAQAGNTFEECLGLIALHLDIALDGTYDVGPLCEVLVTALRNKRMHPSQPHLRALGLIDVELIERSGSLELMERNREVTTIVPDDAIVTETTIQDSRQLVIEHYADPTNDSTGEQDTSAGSRTVESSEKGKGDADNLATDARVSKSAE